MTDIDHVLSEERLFPPSAEFTAKAVISSMEQYEDLYRRAADDSSSFWISMRKRPVIDTTRQFLTWLTQFQLGRKRLLDTLLAATYHEAGIRSVLTTLPREPLRSELWNA